MAFTAQQLADIESAIISLAGGAIEVQIGQKRYRKNSLQELISLRDIIKGEIQDSTDGGIQKIVFVNRDLL